MKYRESNSDKILLVFSLGLTEAIKSKAISIHDAEKLLYSPHAIEILCKYEINEDIINLIHLGTELEDIESMLPDRLPANLDQMSKLSVDILRKATSVNAEEPRWYEKVFNLSSG